jgi:hypothetical protein
MCVCVFFFWGAAYFRDARGPKVEGTSMVEYDLAFLDALVDHFVDTNGGSPHIVSDGDGPKECTIDLIDKSTYTQLIEKENWQQVNVSISKGPRVEMVERDILTAGFVRAFLLLVFHVYVGLYLSEEDSTTILQELWSRIRTPPFEKSEDADKVGEKEKIKTTVAGDKWNGAINMFISMLVAADVVSRHYSPMYRLAMYVACIDI